MRGGIGVWLGILAWGLGGSGGASEVERRPNIVLIVADDLGWGDVGFNGRKEWSTPRLDRLAREGLLLRRCYTAAPICAPSRGAFLTGKEPIHSGVVRNSDDLPSDQTTIAEALKPAGYSTGLFGKWHHGKPAPGSKDYVHPLDQGFDEFFGYTDATAAWEKFPRRLWEGRRRVPTSGYVDDLFTDRALEFLDERRDVPFFLYVAYVAPHFTVAAPEEEVEKHRGRLPEPRKDQRVSAAYAAMITRLDANVGRLVDRLDALGLRDQTLIVFTSDNGATFEAGNVGASVAVDSNRPFRGQKRTLWEGGVRVPTLARWPGRIPSASVSDEVVSLIDLLPTFAAAAGAVVDPAWRLDGLDLLPAWEGRVRVPERTLFWRWNDEGADQSAALRGDFKLIVDHGGKPELYDVASDPAERRDLTALHPETASALRKDLEAWLRTGSE